MNETLKTLRERRSVRRYRPEQIKPEELEAILDAGTWAPSAMGKQSAVMVVVQDRETIQEMSRLNAEIQGAPGTDPFYGAPTVVVVLAEGANAVPDGSLVMGNLMNAAWWPPAGSTGPGSSLSGLRARRCCASGGCRRTSREWATAFWAMPTVKSRRRRPEKRGTLSGPEDGARLPGCFRRANGSAP